MTDKELQNILKKLEKIQLSQAEIQTEIQLSKAETKAFIEIIDKRGCRFGHIEREIIKQSILTKEDTVHDSLRDMEDNIDKKIDSHGRWLKGMAAFSVAAGVIIGWFAKK